MSQKYSRSFLFFLKIIGSSLFAILLLAFTTNSVKAWDIWLVTNNRRVIVIRNVETSPTQEFVVQHDSVPHSLNGDFGDIGFAPNGSLYGISMGYEDTPPGNDGLARLSEINLNTGVLTASGSPFTFQWGNALAFDINTGRGYAGGGLEDYLPYPSYELLKRLRYFDNYNPATEAVWHDMSGDYPNGGFAGDFAFANSKAYAIWGLQYWHWNGAAWVLINEHYLLEITLDANKNFISYINLGQSEPLIGEGIWGLASDGQTLYTTSPTALYRVDIAGGVASYTKIMDYALNPGENVNGATSIWTDLALTHTVNNATPPVNSQIILTTTITNQGPYSASEVRARVSLPAGYEYVSSTPSAGSYNSATGEWNLGNLPLGASATLEITVRLHGTGSFESRAEIIHSAQGDPDSHPLSSYTVDDIGDGLPDDDEDAASIRIDPDLLPETGFPRGEVTRVDFSLRDAKYTSTSLELEIPKLDLSIPIVGVPQSETGWDVTWLGESAGYLAGSAFPTWAGNTIITGHVWDSYNQPGIFSELKTLQYGDQIQIHAWGQTYLYEVRESKLVSDKNVDAVFTSEEYDWLTLVTCEFYNPFTKDYLFRRAVRAVLIDVR